ncbi:4-(cytidine 5'-diphospho)-2-C-methyl-D-erythritol kinase [Aerococcus kribbianus]|uniref:4-diphosphocytidyl-2-C-methyl-D-erythritol kinase n=1 Tax=Aerococcus kribbianus TaxID=2999064 RepID=A0A9X3FMU2_9LACT|nr:MULTISPECIES: 4-(cytidine 5'-diphospho)-2-C-methyl-D-erythritol kinase [unclassified Aerococcus]MCZ0717310.1 4-(cytidine 5'-diphospho)-2-C-methyl-D-erythritol kinase [Aerococcus sp. YH-aer221]MCZ0725598.1 4-(cytidine 5'-diphospho)-2-C-methyl-D-erythritol kinase [Aerococcus sp. YH-aer222]
MEIQEIAPAKINLAQDILFKRDDAYHEVQMVMASVDLSDYISLVERGDDEIRVETSQAFLPDDKRNHAYQAAKLMQAQSKHKAGVNIYIEKNIPVAAGLGGGSTDAAAVMRGLNKLWNLNLSQDTLVPLANQIGSDVPYSLNGGTALVEGRGEIISQLPAIPYCWVILAKPAISVSTRKIFQRLRVEELDAPFNASNVVEALKKGDYSALMVATGNALESVTFSVHPELASLKAKMQKFGAQGVTMSGTGPTIIGFVKNQKKGKRIYNALKGFCDEVYLVRTQSQQFIRSTRV